MCLRGSCSGLLTQSHSRQALGDMYIGDSKLTLGVHGCVCTAVPHVQVVVHLSAKRLCHPSGPEERRLFSWTTPGVVFFIFFYPPLLKLRHRRQHSRQLHFTYSFFQCPTFVEKQEKALKTDKWSILHEVYFCSWCPIRSVIYISTFCFFHFCHKTGVKEVAVKRRRLSKCLSCLLQKEDKQK